MKSSIDLKSLKILLAVIGCLSVLYAWAILFLEPDGVRRWMELDSQHRQMVEENRRLTETNHQMRVRIDALKSDPALIETIARRELGMTGPNEYAIHLVQQDPKR